MVQHISLVVTCNLSPFSFVCNVPHVVRLWISGEVVFGPFIAITNVSKLSPFDCRFNAQMTKQLENFVLTLYDMLFVCPSRFYVDLFWYDM